MDNLEIFAHFLADCEHNQKNNVNSFSSVAEFICNELPNVAQVVWVSLLKIKKFFEFFNLKTLIPLNLFC